ncbi:MAG TPA: hypothetical protein PKM73_14530 [Verrucomicrobiota bacterium]|nr:hypothetical protein [Verrucomicrobiota bacterium]
MNWNELLKTKTFWTGVSAIGWGAVLCTQGNVQEGVASIIMGLMAITGRDAIAKVEKSR